MKQDALAGIVNVFKSDFCWVYTWHLLLVVVAAFVVWFLTERVIAGFFVRASRRTRVTWDDVLADKKLFHTVARIMPGLVFYWSAGFLFPEHQSALLLVRKLATIYVLFSGAAFLYALFNIAVILGGRLAFLKNQPLQVLSQVLKIVVAIVLVILVSAMLLDKSPGMLLTGLTGLTAILMLIFKDAILGLVAGVQLSANRMLSVGDWLEMPSQDANGDVIEITLTTVKVQNWDKTISTIPTYALISNSFKNWKGMSESGGRRIKRSICIDMSSIQFCTPEMLQDYLKYQLISDYVAQKTVEVNAYNQECHVDETTLINGRRLTNIGTFRAYVVAYLRNHPQIHDDMTFLVRQLAPTELGLPIEIYVFCRDQVWAHYEDIQSDIFDHFLAIIPEFSLRVFQNPTGNDFTELSTR